MSSRMINEASAISGVSEWRLGSVGFTGDTVRSSLHGAADPALFVLILTTTAMCYGWRCICVFAGRSVTSTVQAFLHLHLQSGDGHSSETQRYTSSNGLLSEKHESHTSLTTLVACTSSLQAGRAMTDWIARIRTQFWNCCVSVQLPRVMVSLVHRHSPLSIDARIWKTPLR